MLQIKGQEMTVAQHLGIVDDHTEKRVIKSIYYSDI